jgi:DNA-binding NarL/FixJ family response regulator
MRILIVDDEFQVRSALRLLLEHEAGLAVVGEVDSLADLLAQVKATLPDLILLDWQLPGLDADELSPCLRTLRPGLLVVALESLPENSGEATRWADKVISKLDPPERLLAALGNCWPREACRKDQPAAMYPSGPFARTPSPVL